MDWKEVFFKGIWWKVSAKFEWWRKEITVKYFTTKKNMNLAKVHVYLIFDIYQKPFIKKGQIRILVNKKYEFDKYKNPELVKQEAINLFKINNQEYKYEELEAFYVGDLVPFVY